MYVLRLCHFFAQKISFSECPLHLRGKINMVVLKSAIIEVNWGHKNV